MRITVIKIQGKTDEDTDFVSTHNPSADETVNDFVESVTISRNHWTVISITNEGVEYKTDKDVYAE